MKWYDSQNKTQKIVGDGKYSGGYGTEETPYIISNLEDLRQLSEDANPETGISSHIGDWSNTHFLLVNSINMSATLNWNNGEGFIPIGNTISKFTNCVFDSTSTDNILDGLYINRPTTNYQGLFGFIVSSILSNFTIINSSVITEFGGSLFVANCNATNTDKSYLTNLKVINSQLISVKHSGFIAGLTYYSIISKCSVIDSTTNITSLYTSTVSNGYAPTGIVFGISSYCVVSETYSKDSRIEVLDGPRDKQHTGGIYGICKYSDTRYCYSLNNVVIGIQAYVGGIAGRAWGSSSGTTATNLFVANTTLTTNHSYCYALFGTWQTNPTPLNCYYDSTTCDKTDYKATGLPTTTWDSYTLADLGFDDTIWTKTGTYPDLINNPR